ncbi:uncharacterized protein TNCV_320201 [Trichonephila clavipes]|nr:uncharacterized protein TNCV_320201 [Trichonephila clavipes]
MAAAVQSKSSLMAKTFLDSTLTVTPHKSLNCSRGVISESNLLCASEAEILEGLFDQSVTQSEITTSIKDGYLNCKIRPYVPNPLRCFKFQRFGHSQTACRGQLTCSRCSSVGHASSDCSLELKCVNCSQPHSADSKLYENTKIVCPPLKLLSPLISDPKPTISSSVSAVNKSSTSTQAVLVPSTSSVLVASPSKSQPPNSVIDTVPTASNSLSISAASSSSTACSVLETTNTIPATSQDANQTSKPRRKKRPPKNQSNTIKPKIEIKMAPHRPRKSEPTEYTTDEEDMIMYDVCVWKKNLS